MFSQQLRRGVLGTLLATASALALCGVASRAAADSSGDPLIGTFALTGGSCPNGAGTGSYFRMVQPKGSVSGGPYVANGDSTCSDQTFTLLAPGADSGFVTGAYQPAPTPTFDGSGNSQANRITLPTTFFGVKFGLSTDPKDPQSGKDVQPLSVSANAGALSGDLRAWSASWNKQYFNQGAPKPDGSTPGLTAPAHGAYDASTGAFVLEWTSTVVGGPFNDFTGVWHVQGTFRSAAAAGASSSSNSGGSKAAATGSRNATTATTIASSVADEQVNSVAANTASPATGSSEAIGAIERRGWKPPAWLIVFTALIGVLAAAALLMPTRFAPTGGDAMRPGPPDAPTTNKKSSAKTKPAVAKSTGAKKAVPARSRRRAPQVAALAIGLGLALAPVAFQMFTRAPKGGDMIESFKPYMRTAKIDSFSGFLDDVGAANNESAVALRSLPPATTANYAGVSALNRDWPGIDADMRDMLTTMRADIPRYNGIAALPPFVLFPWFFVLPGLMIAGVAGWSVIADRDRAPARGRVITLAVLGVGLMAAPAMFQMFTRAPGGAEMINDFKPLMEPAKVTRIQGYFLTIGLAEGDLRNKVVPAEAAAGRPMPAATALSAEWPKQSGAMAPMIAAMADNIGNFAAVVALPPFWLFPWFFVFPGILVVALALFLLRKPSKDDPMTSATASAPDKLFSFPNPVNEVSARLVATGVVIMSVAAIVFDARWILPILFYGFVARVLTGPKLSPLGQFVTRFVTPRAPFDAKMVAGPPKRFAQGMGVTFSGIALILGFGFQEWTAAYVVLGLLVIAASLEAFVGLCLGCKIFAGLMRVGIIPEEVCEACNNVGARIRTLEMSK